MPFMLFILVRCPDKYPDAAYDVTVTTKLG
jgi:hypothetical protein